MRPFTLLCAALLAALALTGCAQNQATADNRQADAQALKDLETRWNQEFNPHDPDQLTAHYADDAVLMGPGMPSSSGKDAIKKTLVAMVSDPSFSLKFQTARAEVARSGDIGFTQGTYVMTMTDPATKQPVNDHGSYVTTYRKGPDGAWKAVADIATSEVPPPAPAPADSKKSK